MLIAALTDTGGLSAVVSETFADAQFLLILDAETCDIVKTYDRGKSDDCALARLVVEHDCEAVLCGPIEKAPFVIIADEGGVTRYYASGLSVDNAVSDMLAYRLQMLPDFIGGTGCGSGAGECREHD